MEIDEVQCAYGGDFRRVSFSDSVHVWWTVRGSQFGVSIGQGRSYERERESHFAALCSFERKHVLAL